MAATKWNQDINAGDSWMADINLKTGTGTNRDITNHTLASEIKRHYKSVNVKEPMNVEIKEASSGRVKLSLTAVQTTNLKFGKWIYDVELTDRRGSVVTIAGDGGSGAKAVAVVNTSGAISGITILNGGTGYTTATVTITDTRTVTAPEVNGSGATATATITGGVITGITIATGGINYVEQTKERVIEGIITIRPEVTKI
jgi:hypothetical protein